ncbi:DUF86 domain-containing protein [Algoriphagus boritolerans]|uniref:HepT-like ribonuclease domain-containing protein n=1 Tax=Algoriphagus boritolerans TaxID=308111 RepID=UPI000AD6A7FD
MKKDPNIYLEHILACIRRILTYTVNLKEDDFLKNPLVQDAVIRNLEIIGEATKKSLILNSVKSILKLSGRR